MTPLPASPYSAGMENFSAATARVGAVFVIRTRGYLDAEAGRSLIAEIEKGFADGYQRFVLDLSGSPVINSPGVVKLLDLAEAIIDQRQGRLAFCGVAEVPQTIFAMVGLLPRVPLFVDEPAALAGLG